MHLRGHVDQPDDRGFYQVLQLLPNERTTWACKSLQVGTVHAIQTDIADESEQLLDGNVDGKVKRLR